MKKIIIAIILVTSSCEFLEKEPIGLPDEENFYTNLNEIQLGLNGVYEVLTKSDFQISYAYIGTGCGDNMVVVEPDKFSLDAQLFSLNSNSLDVFLEDFWFQNYLGIYRANLIIEKAKEVRTFSLGETVAGRRDVRQIVGQAKVLRAFFYFNLVRTFGGVPIKSTVLELDGSEDNFKDPRATKEEVYELIEKDLREAAVALDELAIIVSGDLFANYGKVDEGTAWSLLLKVLAYQAEPGVPSEKWEQAMLVGEHIVDRTSDSFSVSDVLTFNSLYNGDIEELERIKLELANEDISDEEFLTQTAGLGSNRYNLDFNYANLNRESADFNGGSVFEVNHTVVIDGAENLTSPFHSNINHQNILQPTSLFSSSFSDPRLEIAIIDSGDRLIDGSIQNNPPFDQKTSCYKWYTISGENSGLKNFRIMRYAEVILFYSEALNENGDQIRATENLNLLRARARRIVEAGDPRVTSLAGPLDYSVSNYLDTRLKIRNDRRIELCFEFDRFWELARIGEMEEAFSVFNNDVGAEYQKNYRKGISEIFPIPLSEIDASGGLVVQNPGY